MKATKKDLKSNYRYIVRGGYCEFQSLLHNARKIGNASGVYGWNWDAYEIESSNGTRVCICTGYRDMTGARLEGLPKYEDKARKLWNYNTKKSYLEKCKAHEKLLRKFADEIITKLQNKGE